MPKFSIRNKFLIILLLLVFVLLALTNYIWISSVRPMILNQAFLTQTSEADKLSLGVRDFIEIKVRFLILLTQSSIFLDKKIAEQPVEFVTALKQDADILEISVLDTAGKEISKVTREKTYSKEELTDQSNTNAYKIAVFGFGVKYFSPVTFENGQPVMTIAIPIVPAENQRRIETINTEVSSNETPAYLTQKGIIVEKISLNNLNKSFTNLGKTESVYIITSEGILIGTNKGPSTSAIDLSNSDIIKHFKGTNSTQDSFETKGISNPQENVYTTDANISDLDWILVIEEPTSVILKDVDRILNIAILILVSGIIVSFFAAIFISRGLTKPIEQLSFIVSFLGKGDFSKRVLIKTNDELETLGQAFNSMADLIQKQIEDLKKVDQLKDEFIGIISHNLRTPLTAIKGYTEMLMQERNVTEDDKHFTHNLLISVNSLERLVEEVLNITTLGSGGVRLNLKPTKIEDITNEILTEVEALAKMKNISIKVKILPDLPLITLDKNRIKDVLINLLENAIKFSTASSDVEVIITKENNNLIFRIKDHGIGIDAQVIPTLFQRFHRGLASVTSQFPGMGLGLYFCKIIIEKHHGNIWVESTKGYGSTFSFTIPLIPNIENTMILPESTASVPPSILPSLHNAAPATVPVGPTPTPTVPELPKTN